MRSRPNTPAAQLRSVCTRYAWRGPGARAQVPAILPWLVGAAPVESAHPPVASDSAHRQAALARLEAIFLLAREPLTSRKLSQFANLADATEARTLIRQLNERYDQRGRAFRVVEVAGGYQLLTRPQFAAWVRRLQQSPSEVRLSAPALETLAVIAYRQPVGRADIEAIRGVNCGEIIRQLMDRDLVRIGARSQELGRPYLYATTRYFLQIFGLSSLEDLPRAEVIRQAVIPAPAADQESRVSTTDIIEVSEEDSDVRVTTQTALALEEEKLRRGRAAALPLSPVITAEDEDDDFEDEDEDDDDLDDEDDFEDEDEEEEDDLDDEEDEDFDDEDLEDEEWEEVDDEEEEDLDEEDDLDDDDDDWDDDEEEEEFEDEE